MNLNKYLCYIKNMYINNNITLYLYLFNSSRYFYIALNNYNNPQIVRISLVTFEKTTGVGEMGDSLIILLGILNECKDESWSYNELRKLDSFYMMPKSLL